MGDPKVSTNLVFLALLYLTAPVLFVRPHRYIEDFANAHSTSAASDGALWALTSTVVSCSWDGRRLDSTRRRPRRGVRGGEAI